METKFTKTINKNSWKIFFDYSKNIIGLQMISLNFGWILFILILTILIKISRVIKVKFVRTIAWQRKYKSTMMSEANLIKTPRIKIKRNRIFKKTTNKVQQNRIFPAKKIALNFVWTLFRLKRFFFANNVCLPEN